MIIVAGFCPIFTSNGFIDWKTCDISIPNCPNCLMCQTRFTNVSNVYRKKKKRLQPKNSHYHPALLNADCAKNNPQYFVFYKLPSTISIFLSQIHTVSVTTVYMSKCMNFVSAC